MNRPKKEKPGPSCTLFKCIRLRAGKLCCRFCDRRDICFNPCLNDPEKCGKYEYVDKEE